MCLPNLNLIGSPVTALPFDEQIETMLQWAKRRVTRVVCVANVHMLMEAYWQSDFGSVLKDADMITPDGMPLVWMMRLSGAHDQDRVAGVDILQAVCERAQHQDVSVYFVGSQSSILDRMKDKLMEEFPKLKIACMQPLPFRPLTAAEDEELIQQINDSGAGIVFVSLGCPKQEKWMAQHRGKINAVMVGLGGAFPVYAGIQSRAPQWARESGLEWLYRLIQEPSRLWKRYSSTIPPFLWLAFKQLVKKKFFSNSLHPQKKCVS